MEKIERKTRDLDISLDPYPEIAILPANTRKLVPMAPERRTEFAARLKAIVDEIENAKGDGARGGVQSADVGPPHRELVGLACATCRGYCCRAGGNEAYMTPAVFRRVLAQSPDLTPADLQRAYLSRIPQESYEESCIFHSRTGCTLPRDRRADICNNFLCSGVRDLPADPDAQRLAAAIGATGIVRLALIGGDGNSLLFEEE